MSLETQEAQPQALPPEEQAKQEHQRKLDGDPTRQFWREQGFQEDPKVLYSMDVISATNSKGEKLMGSKIFDNFEDLQNFIRNNPDVLTQRQKDQMKEGIMPFGVGYDKSVYDWSGSLPPEKSQQMNSAWDGFSAENFDTRKWGSKEKAQERTVGQPKEKTPLEIKQDIINTENESLSHLNNPEMSQIVADPKDLGEVVREMGVDARQFEDPEKKILANMAQNDLEQLNRLLSSEKPEDLTKADQVVANYLHLTLSRELSRVFNSAGLPITWEDKKRLLDQSILADKISKRPDILKSRDLISVRRRVREQVSQYFPNQQEQPATPGGRTEEEIEKMHRRIETIMPSSGPPRRESATKPGTPVKENPAQGKETENPYERLFSSKEATSALETPTRGYDAKQGTAAMVEVFKSLYPDPKQFAARVESLVSNFRSAIETAKGREPTKSEEVHRIIANKEIIKGLSQSEIHAIDQFLDANYKKMGGSGHRIISTEMPFGDFLDFIEGLKK